MTIPYKHICSICGKIFFSKFRGQNICSKVCRNTIKRIKKYRKCIVCGWDATIEVHHEGGKEYDFCPNHHSLLTTGKQNLEEVLKSIVKSPQKPKCYICPIVDLREDKLEECPIINGSYKIKRSPMDSITSKLLYERIKKSTVRTFTYKDIMKLCNWEYERVKKHILNLIRRNKIECSIFSKGQKEAIFVLK